MKPTKSKKKRTQTLSENISHCFIITIYIFMNSIIIGQTIEIPQLVIAELNGVNKEIVVHSIITTTNSLAEKLYT